jgi:competence protein ComEC
MPARRPPAFVVVCVAAAIVLALTHAKELRDRASASLGRGVPTREAELARGFVLGEDEGIDPVTIEDFRRAGLSHLLAVSGQNVALLALLAVPVLAALGMPLRTRLLWLLGLIAVYVSLAGAGPSIQRAGVMGALSVLATLAGRRAARLYALVVAAIVTLAIEPAIAADVGWQLSFAAVLGILLLASRLREAIAAVVLVRGAIGRTLVEGAAMTIAATLATVPLIAFHFGELSTTTLVANLLALPAVAPAMWLGMLSAAAGQLPGVPVEVFNYPNALLLAYIAQVASWCGRPGWASVEVALSAGGLAAAYVGPALVVVAVTLLRRRRRIAALHADGPKSQLGVDFSARRHGSRAVLVAALFAALVAWTTVGRRSVDAASPSGLRISVLDVGQGDAILLQPAGAAAILVDGGPPGADLAGQLSAAGVERLGAAVLTHDQSDHAGGIEELLGRLPIERLLYATAGRRLLTEARSAGAVPQRLARGAEIRAGSLHLEAIWPPHELLARSLGTGDPNQRALVLIARWRDFSMLLAADAEAESVPLDPGPVDVLKVAHHGTEDAGLANLLDRTAPKLALISVGEDNSYGHPSPLTLAALADDGIPTLRTDMYGDIVLDVSRASIAVSDEG